MSGRGFSPACCLGTFAMSSARFLGWISSILARIRLAYPGTLKRFGYVRMLAAAATDETENLLCEVGASKFAG